MRMPGLVVVSAFAFAPLLHAQAKERGQARAPPAPPKMSAEGKKFLDGWVGIWVSNDTVYTAGGQRMQGSLKMICESVSSGWGTLCKPTMSGAGRPARVPSPHQ
jgi:hypothetical protein